VLPGAGKVLLGAGELLSDPNFTRQAANWGGSGSVSTSQMAISVPGAPETERVEKRLGELGRWSAGPP
jgi:hypothetical protein